MEPNQKTQDQKNWTKYLIEEEIRLRKAKEARGVPDWKTRGEWDSELRKSADKIIEEQKRERK